MTILEFKRYFKSELSELYIQKQKAPNSTLFLYEKTGFDRFQQSRFAHQELLISDERRTKRNYRRTKKQANLTNKF